mmetsp:Transcript_16639/g.41974  ORF Transcript_16639/g.41974 Transcript_16639/m.41974 type:complete len:251 (+) Transcript_16639:518-1270(+)
MRLSLSMSSADAPGEGGSSSGLGASSTALPPPLGVGEGGEAGGRGELPSVPSGPSPLPSIVSVEFKRLRSEANKSSSTVTPSSMSVYSLAMLSSFCVSSLTRCSSSSSSSAAVFTLQYTRPPPIAIVAKVGRPFVLTSFFLAVGGGALAARASGATGDRTNTPAAPTNSALRKPPTTRRQRLPEARSAATTGGVRTSVYGLGYWSCVGSAAGLPTKAAVHKGTSRTPKAPMRCIRTMERCVWRGNGVRKG